MDLKIENNKLICVKNEEVMAETINQFETCCEFSEEWEGLSKKIIYAKDGRVWQESIINNKSTIPPLPRGTYEIGIVGFIVEDDKIVEKKATNCIFEKIFSSAAEHEPNQEIEDIGASTYERYLQEITAKSLEINGYLGSIEELAEQIEKDKTEIAQDKIDIERSRQEILDSADAVTDMMTSLNFAQFYIDEYGKLHIVSESELINNKFRIEKGKLVVSCYENG